MGSSYPGAIDDYGSEQSVALQTELGTYAGRKFSKVTTDQTLTAADNNKVYLAAAVDLTFTLPSTVAGLRFTFICHTVSATTGLSISPAAADAIHFVTSVDDKDLINTAATDVEGDAVTLVGDGVDGWWVVGGVNGTWAKEA